MGYAKSETIKKQQKLVSKGQRNSRKLLVNLFKILLVGIIAGIIACAGAGFGMMKGILDNAPDVSKISIVPKGFRTNIYDANGNEERELATYNSDRVYVYYDEIPKDIVNAFVAIEDQRFWTHNGIDVRGIFRAFFRGAASGKFDEGASTLTQQLIKNHVFNVGLDERTFMDRLERKVQEMYLAIELEKKYTKEELVEYYLNTIYLGRGVHGIQAAANKYFGKDMTELTISEIAAIAGITKNPTGYDPILYPEDSSSRREDVLDKMLELEYITKQQYDEAMADDVYARISEIHEIEVAQADVYTYYEDAIINQLTQDFMELYQCTETEASNLIYTGGYEIYSVQDEKIQNIVDSVMNNPDYLGSGTKVGLTYELTLVDPNKEEHNYWIGHLTQYFAEKTGNEKYNSIYPSEEAARAAADEFKEAMINQIDGTFVAETFTVTPQPQTSFTIMDQKTGYVKAMYGGRGEKKTNLAFNRATDAKRQPGSTFKIVAAYYPLIESGQGGLATCFNDEPYQYAGGGDVRNAGGGHSGLQSIRIGIQNSINVLAVKAITKVGPDVAYDYLMKLGYTTLIDQEIDTNGAMLTDKTQACALGGLSKGVYNIEMTAAYAAIANGGIYNKPIYYSKVIDHDGNVVIDNTTPTSHRAMRETTAWQLIDAMKNVVRSGTGTPARLQSGMTCAGKTGTTSSNYDLWFCGMTPYYTASIWMGYDSNVDMGGSNTHKYMWRDIMDQIVELEGQDTTADWVRPDGLTQVTLCKMSGLLPGSGCPTYTDWYAKEDLPGKRCEGHANITLCTESHKIANSGCPETIEFAVEVDENGKKSLVSVDGGKATTEYEYTEEECDIHTPEEEGEITIKSSAGKGGSISKSAKVPKGSSVTFFITPQSGYQIKDVLVNGKSVGVVTSYTFENVQANATIKVKFQKVSGGDDPGDDPGDKPQKTTKETTTEATTQSEETTTQAPIPMTTTEAPTTQAPTTQAPPSTDVPVAPSTDVPVVPDPNVPSAQ
ncbi:MAG: transglycosylase domain-containing protein [Wujia sp.]